MLRHPSLYAPSYRTDQPIAATSPVLGAGLPVVNAARRRRANRLPLVLVGCLLLSGYFMQHALSGKHGLQARARLQERALRATAQVKTLNAERQRLQQDVALLAADPPDADLLREIAIDVLGFVPVDALVMTTPATNPMTR
jgi:cell division protein FtsB